MGLDHKINMPDITIDFGGSVNLIEVLLKTSIRQERRAGLIDRPERRFSASGIVILASMFLNNTSKS